MLMYHFRIMTCEISYCSIFKLHYTINLETTAAQYVINYAFCDKRNEGGAQTENWHVAIDNTCLSSVSATSAPAELATGRARLSSAGRKPDCGNASLFLAAQDQKSFALVAFTYYGSREVPTYKKDPVYGIPKWPLLTRMIHAQQM